MENLSKHISTKKLLYGQNLLGHLFFYFGIAAIFDYFISVKILGLSFFVTIIPYTIIFFLFFKNIKYLNNVDLFFYFSNIFLFFSIIVSRSVLYGESALEMIGANRYVLFVPVLLMLIDKFDFNKFEFKKSIFNLSILILLIHSCNSLFYIAGYPFIEHVDVLADDYVPFSRFGGIMGGANVQGVFTSTIYMIIVLSNWRISILKFIFISLIAIVAVLPTLSRGGVIVISIPFFYYILMNLKSTKKIKLVVLVSIVVFVFLSQIEYTLIEGLLNAYTNRINQDDFSSGRWDRLVYFFQIINKDFISYIIGSPHVLQSNGGNEISDNVFTLIPVNFGFIFSFIFLLQIILLASRRYNFKNAKTNYFLLVILIICFTNNSIIWTAWTYCSVFGFYYLSRRIS